MGWNMVIPGRYSAHTHAATPTTTANHIWVLESFACRRIRVGTKWIDIA